MDFIKEQKILCERYDSSYTESPSFLKVGISINIRDGIYPINGLRHPMRAETTGWYIWAGDYSSDPNFFVPLHVEHLKDWCPQVMRFLGLAPGWRFLIAANYEDVWKDISLLNAD
jgi:hypothetical protein